MMGDSARLLAPAAGLLMLLVAGCPFNLPKPQLPEISGGVEGSSETHLSDTLEVFVPPPVEDIPEPKDKWWFVPDTTTAPDDPFPVWDVVWQDTPKPPDGLAPPDVGGGEGEWVCEIGGVPQPLDIFGPDIVTHSFFRRSEILDPHLITVSYKSCGIDGYNPQQEEKTYPLKLDFPSTIRISLECNYPCYAFLMKNGCHYENITGCWYGEEGQVQAEMELLPALYVLGVEFLSQPDVAAEDFQFDLHLALNHKLGQEECAAESHLLYSDLEESCAPGKEGLASATVDGTLGWDSQDDFYLGCSQFGTPADPVGGVPDVAHALTLDFPGPGPATVSAELAFPGAQPGAQAGILALTGAPCGASDTVVDCNWGFADSLAVDEVTAFPGQTLYAVVDTMAAGGLDLAEPVEYELTWTVAGACSP